MVPEVLPDSRSLVQNGDAKILQLVLWAHARQHQDVWRLERPGRQNDLVGLDDERLSAALGLNSDGLVPIEHDAPDEDVAPDGEVQAVSRRAEVSKGGAHPHAVHVVHGHQGQSEVVRAIHVRSSRVAGFQAGSMKHGLDLRPVASVVPARDGQGAFRAVEIVLDVQVSFHLAVER